MSDPGARINVIGGRYNLPGQTGVAYKMTGEYPHAIYYGFTTYDDLWQIPGANYVRNDSDSLAPDAGSINPFIPGNLIAAPNRSYTLWLWPDDHPRAAGLEGNVMPYPTQPQDPRTGAPGGRWLPSVRRAAWLPPDPDDAEGHAVIDEDPEPQRCPLSIAGTYASQIQSGLAKIRDVGPIVLTPDGARQQNPFARPPGSPGSGSMASPPTAVMNYVLGRLSETQLSVVTMHRVPGFFDNRNLPPDATMQDNNTAYNSLIVAGLPYIRGFGQFDSPLIQQNKPWTSVYLPGVAESVAARQVGRCETRRRCSATP